MNDGVGLKSSTVESDSNRCNACTCPWLIIAPDGIFWWRLAGFRHAIHLGSIVVRPLFLGYFVDVRRSCKVLGMAQPGGGGNRPCPLLLTCLGTAFKLLYLTDLEDDIALR